MGQHESDDTIKQVVVDVEAPQPEINELRAAFARAGFDVEVEAAYIRRSVGPLPWIVDITIATPIATFFAQFGAEAGKDAYAAVKAFVKDAIAARTTPTGRRGAIDLGDPDGTRLIVASSIPDEALDALASVDWDELAGGYLIWNEDERRWVDQLGTHGSAS